jgi:hypothetical protein
VEVRVRVVEAARKCGGDAVVVGEAHAVQVAARRRVGDHHRRPEERLAHQRHERAPAHRRATTAARRDLAPQPLFGDVVVRTAQVALECHHRTGSVRAGGSPPSTSQQPTQGHAQRGQGARPRHPRGWCAWWSCFKRSRATWV